MTRFEEACQSEFDMALTVAFCIAGYLEQYDDFAFGDDKLTEFLEKHIQILKNGSKKKHRQEGRMQNEQGRKHNHT